MEDLLSQTVDGYSIAARAEKVNLQAGMEKRLRAGDLRPEALGIDLPDERNHPPAHALLIPDARG